MKSWDGKFATVSLRVFEATLLEASKCVGGRGESVESFRKSVKVLPIDDFA